MKRFIAPFDSTDHGIISIFRAEKTAGVSPTWFTIVCMAVLVAAAWIGGVAFLSEYRPTQISRPLLRLAPRDVLFWGSIATAAAVALSGLLAKRSGVFGAGLMTGAYLLGFKAIEWLPFQTYSRHSIPFRDSNDALLFCRNRVVFMIPIAAAMGLVALLLYRKSALLYFGWGNWSVQSREGSIRSPKQPYWRFMFPGYVLWFGVPLAIVMQALVGFRPITSGVLWALLPSILLAALVNATLEEIIYRGLFQPAFIRAAGLAWGLWMQGLLFGLVHWGLSIGVLAALPVSLLIGLGSVVWGKAAYETRGLGFVIIAHFIVDVAIMCAYFAGEPASPGG